MTTIESHDFAKTTPPGFALTVLRIAQLAIPLMVGSLALAGLHILKTAMLTHHGETNALYTLSMVQPAFIFMLAFLESLAITNQVFSSKSVTNWAKGDVLRSTRVFSVVGVVIALLLAGLFQLGAMVVGGVWADGPKLLPQMALFVLSMIPYMLFEMRNGALRGQGRTGLALLPFSVLILADMAISWVGIVHYGLGFNAILIGSAAGPLIALPLTVWLLRREIGDAPLGPSEAFRKHMIGLCIGVALPVFASMFAGSASAAVLFPAMAALGQEISSGFLVIVRMRILFIIPAVAVGSAIAILINQLPEAGHAAEKASILRNGAIAVLAVYAAATFGLYAARFWLVDLVVPSGNAALFAATVQMMSALIVTFFLIAGFTMLQVILEHLGLGVRVLIITILSELATIGLAMLALGYGLAGLIWVMNGLSALTFLVLTGVFVHFTRQMERNHAV